MKPSSLPPSDRRSALITARRATAALLAFLTVFLFLGVRIFVLQVFGYAEYQERVMEEITVSSSMRAERGTVYDTNGAVLATSKTVYRIYISPKNIASVAKRTGEAVGARIADGLSAILGVSRETILKKTEKTRFLDETVLRGANAETAARVLSFVAEEELYGLVATEASTTRRYPSGTLLSHVLGFVGSDGQGLFGLEYYYDDDLRGIDGAYLSAVDAHGNDKSYGYTTYREPTNGLSLVTTVDSYIQRSLEASLAEIVEEFDVRDRATGIVMNVNTGAILAMATAPSFDLNSPYELDPLSAELLASSGLTEGSEDYKKKKNELLLSMWQNKPVSALYEPGSTFKIVTSAMALDLGVTTPTDASFFCGGSYSPVKGVNISCWRKIGHGRGFTYAHGLQQSCNCAMMQVVSRIGSERFYEYFTAFGLREKTGIDLPSEAGSIFHTAKGLGTVELATSSFGQRFKVTPLQELTAIAAVANGGYLVTPHLIERLVDETGQTVYEHETRVVRQAVSTEAANSVCAMLEEGVSGTGASRNAYAAGFRIAAKTGTSEKLDKADASGNYSLRIGSCVGFAPYDDPEIAMIIVVDEPTTAHFGATVAAPYISRMMSVTLPYLGYEAVYKEKEEELVEIPIGSYVGMTVKEAAAELKKLGMTAVIKGGTETDTVISQMPSAGSLLSRAHGRVLLYTGKDEGESAVVPELVGLGMEEAVKRLLDAGLNIRLSGTVNTPEGATAYPKAARQSVPAGTAVPMGTAVTVEFLYDDTE